MEIEFQTKSKFAKIHLRKSSRLCYLVCYDRSAIQMTSNDTNLKLEAKQETNSQLIQLVDDFAEFHSMNSFLIQAMASAMTSPEPVVKDVQQGARLFALTLRINRMN
jgi:hypothetical protein